VIEARAMISQNDFKRQWQVVEDSVMAAVRRLGASGWYILGKEVEAFEQALAEFWGVTHAVGTGNGLDALEIALRCLGLQSGDKVLTTPLSAFATTLAILRAGGVPVFVDVDENGGIDLAQCRQLLEHDRSVRFFVPVHLYGFPLDMEKLRDLQREHDLKMVEDCAQSIGAAADGVITGTVGQASATSFYPTKNLGAFGDAGAILTNDPAIAAAAREMRNYGQSAHYVHSRLGLNSRLDEFHAAIMREALLPRLEEWTTARRRIARHYLDEIRNPALELPKIRPNAEPVWHLFPVLVKDKGRPSFQEHLTSAGVTSGVHYPRIIPQQQALRGFTFETAADLRNAMRFADNEVSLPIHPFLTGEEMSAVIEACNTWPG
jgi:dTDP-4-amino-4,6-dideoxygalactose transaminase